MNYTASVTISGVDKLSGEVQRMVASLTTLHAALAKISGFGGGAGGGGGIASIVKGVSSVAVQTAKAQEKAATDAERQIRKLMDVNRKATDEAERLAKKSAEYSMSLIRQRAETERKAQAEATKAGERAAAEAERQIRKVMAVNRKATEEAEALAKRLTATRLSALADVTTQRAAGQSRVQAARLNDVALATGATYHGASGTGAIGATPWNAAGTAAVRDATTHFERFRNTLLNTEVNTARLIRAFVTLYASMRFFRLAIGEAITFAATLEQSRLAIAATLLTFKQYQDARGGSLSYEQQYAVALKESSKAQNLLRVAAFSTTATFEELVAGFQKVVSAAAGSKASTKDMVDLTTTISNYSTATGQSFETVSNQFRTVLLGISRTTGTVGGFMRSLGVTPDVLRSWREQGTIVENVQKRLQAFLFVGPDLNRTWAGAVSNLKDVMENILGEGFVGAIAAAKGAIQEIAGLFVNIPKSIDVGEIVFNKSTFAGIERVSESIARLVALLKGFAAPALVGMTNAVEILVDGFSQAASAIKIFAEVFGPAIKVAAEFIKLVGPGVVGVAALGFAIQGIAAGVSFLFGPLTALLTLTGRLSAAMAAYSARVGLVAVETATLGSIITATQQAGAALLTLSVSGWAFGIAAAFGVATLAIKKFRKELEEREAAEANRRATDATKDLFLRQIGFKPGAEQTVSVGVPMPFGLGVVSPFRQELKVRSKVVDDISDEQAIQIEKMGKARGEIIKTVQALHQADVAAGVARSAFQLTAIALEGIGIKAAPTNDELGKMSGVLLQLNKITKDAKLNTIGEGADPFSGVKESYARRLSAVEDVLKAAGGKFEQFSHIVTDPLTKLTGEASIQAVIDKYVEKPSVEAWELVEKAVKRAASAASAEYAAGVKKIKQELASNGAALDEERDKLQTQVDKLSTVKKSETLTSNLEELAREFKTFQDRITSAKIEPDKRSGLLAWLEEVRKQVETTAPGLLDKLQLEEAAKEARKADAEFNKLATSYARLGNSAEQSARQRAYAAAEAKKRELDDLLLDKTIGAGGTVDFRRLAASLKLRNEAFAAIDADLKEQNAQFDADDLRRERKHSRDLLAVAQTRAEGVTLAFQIMTEKIRSDAQVIADSIMGAFDSLESALGDGFFAVMTGNFEELGNVAKRFMDSILRSGANNLAESLKNGLLKLISHRTNVGTMPGDANAHLAEFNRRPPDAQIGEAYNTAVQVAAAAYAGYNSYAMAKKSGKNGLESSGEGLISAGAGLISVVPVVGIIVAALGIVAKILGVNSRKDLAQTFSSKAWVGAGMPEDAQRAYENIPKAFMTYMSSVFEAGASGSKANELISALNSSVIDYFRQVSYRAHAGSAEHLQADLEKILSTYAPRDLMRLAFGRTIQGPERPGVDVLGGPRGEDYFDPNAPIPRLLAGLGFTAAKIKQLSDQIDSADPKAFSEKLKGLVEVVVGLTDLAAAFRGGAIFDAIEADRNRTASAALGERAGLIGTRAATLLGGLLIPEEEQIARAKEIIDLAQKYYDDAKAAIKALQDKWAELTAQIGLNIAQIMDVVHGKGEDWLNADTRGGISRNLTRLGIGANWSDPSSTLTPEQMAALAQETIGLVNQLFQSLAKQLQQAETTLAGIEELIGKFDEGYDHSATTLSRFRDKFADFGKQVEDAAKLTGKAQLDAIEGVRQSAVELYQLQQQLLQTIATNVEDLTRSIDSQIGDILATFSHTEEGRDLERRMAPLLAKSYAGTITDAERQQLGDLQGQYDSVLGREQAQRSLNRIRELQAQIPLASSPEAIRRITDEIQAEVSRYMGTFKADDPNRIAAANDAVKILEDTRAAAKAAYAAMEAEIKAAGDAIRKSLEGTTKDLTDAITSIKNQMEALVSVLNSLNLVLGEGFGREITAIQTRLGELAPVITSLTGLFTDLSKAIGGGTGTGGGTGGGGKLDPEVNVIDGLGAVGQKASSLATGPLNDMEGKVNRVNAALDALASRLEGGGGGGSDALSSADFIRQNPNYLRLRTR